MLADYHIHVAAHGEYKYSRERIAGFLDKALERGITELGFSEHEEYTDLVDITAIENARSVFAPNKIKLGLEADYIPGQEAITRQNILSRNYDYIIGSIHYIDGWGFDHPDFKERFDYLDIDAVYQDYFSLVINMVQSGLYDIVGHMDLIKVWGYRPSHRIDLTAVLKAIKLSGMAVELNSGGLRKPVHEIYPDENIVRAMYSMNIPVTLGSDAHEPDQVGEDFKLLADTARKAGYRSITTFNLRRQYQVSL